LFSLLGAEKINSGGLHYYLIARGAAALMRLS